MGTGGSSLVSLYLGARKRKRRTAPPARAFFCFGGRRDRCGRAAGAGAADAPAGQHRYHPARSRGLRRSHPAGRAFHCSSLALAQCLRAEGKARKAWPDSLQAGFEHCAGPSVHLHVGHGHPGCGRGHGAQPGDGVGRAALVLCARQNIRAHFGAAGSPHPADGEADFHHRLPSLCRHCGNALATIVLNRAAGGFETLPSPRSASHPRLGAGALRVHRLCAGASARGGLRPRQQRPRAAEKRVPLFAAPPVCPL